jgi:hypothetical protein
MAPDGMYHAVYNPFMAEISRLVPQTAAFSEEKKDF